MIKHRRRSHIPPYLVSGCLVGLACRYDNCLKPNPTCLSFLKDKNYIPVCPEQLGGLTTPRVAADIADGDGHSVLAGEARVVTKEGVDVTDAFIRGAQQVLEIADQQNVEAAILKSKSPSCAVSGRCGVTAALLAQHDIKLIEF